MAEIEVREAKLEDMEELGRIMAVSFRSAFASFISQKTLDSCAVPENCGQLLRGIFQSGQMHFLAGILDGRLCAELIWTKTDEGAEIMAIHSLPESWGCGLGAALVTRAIRAIGAGRVYLWAFEKNLRARRFYEKMGFVCSGESRVSEFDGAVEVRYDYEICGI